ncbi:serine hydrolase domain-containing protein [Caballeronia mineralivorans]|uniref:serine hydrolase domain-containing protein n=1 Tax=Caballeronia mineralivorans TaxID=2010198 RepID=UPI00069FFB05|nr:serine hydrolase domain-containing protein [Caballeronia mineralivorans]
MTAALHEQQAAMTLFVTGKDVPKPWGIAAGMADASTARALTIDTPLRVASNTKTFVAATVLRLWEQGALALDEPISPLLTPTQNRLLKSRGYRTEKITVRQLLSHSAGLYDHADDPRYFKALLANPTHHWTREVSGGNPASGYRQPLHAGFEREECAIKSPMSVHAY